ADHVAVTVPAVELGVEGAEEEGSAALGVFVGGVEEDGGAGLGVEAGQVKEGLVRPPLAEEGGRAFAGEDDGGGALDFLEDALAALDVFGQRDRVGGGGRLLGHGRGV